MFVVVGIVISFYFSVRLVTWLMVKISAIELFLELRRELNPRHKPPLDMPGLIPGDQPGCALPSRRRDPAWRAAPYLSPSTPCFARRLPWS